MATPLQITTAAVVLVATTTPLPGRACASSNCGNTVRGQFDPVYCSHHRGLQPYAVGWGYIYRDEARLLSLLRSTGRTREVLEELTINGLVTVMDAATIANPIVPITNEIVPYVLPTHVTSDTSESSTSSDDDDSSEDASSSASSVPDYVGAASAAAASSAASDSDHDYDQL